MLDRGILKFVGESGGSSRGNPPGPSCLHAPSIGCGPDVCGIRTSYVSRQCTSSDGDGAAPCLLRRLAAPCLLRGLAIPDWLILASRWD
ncbi:hypothetical protein Tco_1203803 [Tanacetum coccineum]